MGQGEVYVLQALKVANFRSLGSDVSIMPGRLTFLVGPNASGKSNVLDVVAFVRDAVVSGLPQAVAVRNGIGAVRRHSRGRPRNVRVELQWRWEDGQGWYAFELASDSERDYRVKKERGGVRRGERHAWVSFEREEDVWSDRGLGLSPRIDPQSLALTALGGSEHLRPLYDGCADMAVYSIFPDRLGVPQKFDARRPMRAHGENWASILKQLLERGGDERRELVAALRRVTNDIDDVRVRMAASHLVVEFLHRSEDRARKRERWLDAGAQSDGTLRVAGLLTALLQQPPLALLGIEEPEITVHPGVLPVVYDFLREAAQRSQLLVTTHSPELLDLVSPEHATVLAVQRQDGATVVRAVDAAQLDAVRQGLFQLGDLLSSGAWEHDGADRAGVSGCGSRDSEA
ncbi:MAG: hypothetical protein D6776_01285 [Planctomycetota bacterium]|nr:MAG: hypothetical protein D6776_01285 [Planctomycetota bacterium]